MKSLFEYLTIKPKSSAIIRANDKNIMKIIEEEIKRLGNNANLNHIDVFDVTEMRFLFSSKTLDRRYANLDYTVINPDISEWDVSNVTAMDFMFAGCEIFNCDISGWDVSNVTTMYGMFSECKKFNQDLSHWNVSNVTEMSCMFSDCENFNKNISMWNVDKVKEHHSIFKNCPIQKNYKPKSDGKVLR